MTPKLAEILTHYFNHLGFDTEELDQALNGEMYADDLRDRRVGDLEEYIKADGHRPKAAIDLGPWPTCSRCHGSGREDNSQFRCHCRWSTSVLRQEQLSASERATLQNYLDGKA